jgi:putative toxin-antitoxin system antitoxin component (TIGR02293 family)
MEVVLSVPLPERIAATLGGPATLGRRVESLADLEAVVVNGLPKRSLGHLAELATTGPRARSSFIFGLVPEATYKRRRDRLTAEESERIERVARIVTAARDLWGDQDARAFLNHPHPMLEDRTPLAAARTGTGARRVEAILAAIEWGLPV